MFVHGAYGSVTDRVYGPNGVTDCAAKTEAATRPNSESSFLIAHLYQSARFSE
jgi:hypothetical protein